MQRNLTRMLWAPAVALAVSVPVHGQYVRCQGKQSVDGKGANLIVRGIGLGGRLVLEAYMLHMPGFGSPKDICNKIESHIGAAAGPFSTTGGLLERSGWPAVAGTGAAGPV